MSEYTVAGREFSRANFDYLSGTSDRAVICSPARDSLLLWKIEGSYWESVDEAASTIYAIVPWHRAEPSELSKTLAKVHLSQNDSLGLLLRKVHAVYPAEARDNHIEGAVRMQAEISKAGDVETLELVEGPSSWQYRLSQRFGIGSSDPMSRTANRSRFPLSSCSTIRWGLREVSSGNGSLYESSNSRSSYSQLLPAWDQRPLRTLKDVA